VEFASPISWVLFFPKWYKVQWTDVERVRSAQRIPWVKTPYVYQVAVEARIPGEEGVKTFAVRSLNGKYGDFLKYLAAKVNPLKMDEDIRLMLKADNLKTYLNYRAKGTKFGVVWGLVIAGLYLILSEAFKHQRLGGLPVMFWIFIPLSILFGWANKFIVKPPDFKK
jgi:hypothetical protein